MFAPNTRVRLKGDPTRRGFVTGRTRPGRRGKGTRYQVKFPDLTSWVPDDQLEPMPLERETPIDLLQQGKLGRAIDLRRTLTHVRLTGRLADVIYSMEITNTDFYPYQFKPVLRSLLSPSNALLIADEVGLGKTIEAGLIWTELRSRFDLRRLLVLCPAFLREKWQRELAHKFGVRADIVDATGLRHNLQSPDATLHGFAMICSLQGARPNRGWRDPETDTASADLAKFLETREHEEPLVDLLVIDEAHYLRNPESQTNELGHLFRPIAEHLLLLSATPIHNYNQDLFTLLRLLDPDTFERPDDLDLLLRASQPLVQARDHILKPRPSPSTVLDLLAKAANHPLLAGNRQLDLARQHASEQERLSDPHHRTELARRLEMVNPLAYVITRTRKRDVKEWRVVREPVRDNVPMEFCEQTFYKAVTEHVINYAMSRDINERFILATPQRQMSSSMPATLRAWLAHRDNIDDFAAADSSGNRGATKDIGPLTSELIHRAHDFGDIEELTLNDSKYSRVQGILNRWFSEHPQEKVVLFSTFRETLNYLSERLTADEISNLVMHGGVTQDKDEILQQFRESDVRVLLSSEVGSEGIDLQFCRLLVNYDLPWNPMRVEQRIGRLDRLGQQAHKIIIWNLFYEGTIDARIYDRLYDKLDLCRQALGDFEAVLGDEIRRLTTDLLSDKLTKQEQDKRIDQTAQALANIKHEQEQLESEASHLVAYGDYILNQVQAARELNRWISGDDLRTYVTDFFRLRYPGCTFRQLQSDGADYEIELSPAAKQDFEQFIKAAHLPMTTSLLRNTPRAVRCRFENRVTTGREGRIENISQFHPLVRFVSKAIDEHEEQLTPAVSISLPNSVVDSNVFLKGTYVLSVGRWSVHGLQTIEKLVFAAALLETNAGLLNSDQAERLAIACAQHGEDWFEARSSADLSLAVRLADDELFAKLEEQFDEFVDDMRRQNEDRADLQLRNVQRHLRAQRRKLLNVRDRHRLRGRDSLAKATEGRIQALEKRIERKVLEVESRRQVHYRNDEILVALVDIS